MQHFIDRRSNPKGKNLGNRQRFLRRAREHVKDMVDKSVRDKSVKDGSVETLGEGERVTIPAKGIREPKFHASTSGGVRQRVFPGNKEFVEGDKIPRPDGDGGQGGREASEEGEGEDDFSFSLTREEYLEMLFEGLELPDMVKKTAVETETQGFRRAGLTTAGTPATLNLVRTMRNSLGRRIALKRPKSEEMAALEARLAELEARAPDTPEEEEERAALRTRLDTLSRRRRVVGYIDPVDLRFDTHVPEKVRKSKAVVFCLMDVSGSMQMREKELAKRFFLLLHMFLERRYDRTEVVFVRHTHHAEEVDEETFFYARETGGTIVSTALVEMKKIIDARYPQDEWNIYGAQASDGENFGNDSLKCEKLLTEDLLPLCQFYAYVEILPELDDLLNLHNTAADLWQAYTRVREGWKNFDMARVSQPADIYPVFRDLFTPRSVA